MYRRQLLSLSLSKMNVKNHQRQRQSKIFLPSVLLLETRTNTRLMLDKRLPLYSNHSSFSCYNFVSNRKMVKVKVEGKEQAKSLSWKEEWEYTYGEERLQFNKSNIFYRMPCHNKRQTMNSRIKLIPKSSISTPKLKLTPFHHILNHFVGVMSTNTSLLHLHQHSFSILDKHPRRFYCSSKDNENERNEQTESNRLSTTDDAIRNDPWIKSLLNDIRQDFEIHQQKNANENNNKNNEDELRVEDLEVLIDNNSNNNLGSGECEYDYRYADDDIEEFGYFDDAIDEEAKPKRNLPISLNRGVDGVFELEELVTLMEHLGGDNLVTVPIPPQANYCDHMVIVTAKSRRHLKAINDEMIWVHKRKKSKKDPTLHIEGLEKSEWCAMDIGNLVLHVFLAEEKRQYYDIESLWLLGPDNDPKCQEQDVYSFALSAEDLYWMEVEGDHDTKTGDKTEQRP